MKQNMGQFDYEFVAGGFGSPGPLVILRFAPFDVSSTAAVSASEHLMTAQEVDNRVGEIKASLDAAAVSAKAQLAASRSP